MTSADLVPLAELLATIAGDRQRAVDAAMAIERGAIPYLLAARDDLHDAARHELVRTGVINAEGTPQLDRASELVAVCEVIAASTTTVPSAPPEAKIVFTAPEGSIDLEPSERLDGLVLDVIRRATSNLVIGGPYWNDAGFERLNDVLVPAIAHRRVATTIYLNPLEAPYQEALNRRILALREAGPVRVRWFVGPAPRILHAKFIIRDRADGYLGTANLTSWGMSSHIEAGVELQPGQCQRLLRFLDQLEQADLFADQPRISVPAAGGVVRETQWR